MFVAELLRREGRLDELPPPPRPTRLFRLIAAMAGAVLLVGAATASTVALSGPRTERAVPGDPAVSTVAGVAALRPDLISESVGGPATAGPRPAPAGGQAPAGAPPGLPASGEPTPSQSDPAAPGRNDPQAAPPAAPVPARAAEPAPPAPGRAADPVLATVMSFYQTAAVSPQHAFGLLDPGLRGTGYLDFRNAWAGVERVTVDKIRRDGPNAVLVTATLERTDGTVLRTLQRLLVTSGAQPRITGAQLLSASRS